jgi:hypothetical protein
MGKRLGALGAVIAVLALAVGIALPAAGSTGNAAQDQTIRVTAVTTEQKLLDLGGPGFSLGNEIVLSQKPTGAAARGQVTLRQVQARGRIRTAARPSSST